MAKTKVFYEELAKANIRERCELVVSKCSKGGITLAQQLSVIGEDNNHIMDIFLKGAIHVDNLEGLKNMRDAINVAIKTLEEEEAAIKPVESECNEDDIEPDENAGTKVEVFDEWDDEELK